VFEGFAKTFTADYAGQPGKQQKLNLVTGFETYLGIR
jgi:nitrogenase molybdenum-iron protein beta chain